METLKSRNSNASNGVCMKLLKTLFAISAPIVVSQSFIYITGWQMPIWFGAIFGFVSTVMILNILSKENNGK